MLIPHRELSAEALQGLIEEFVTRDGTDYGEWEVPLEKKVAQIMKQLDQGTLLIVYDDQGGTSIIAKDQLPKNLRADDPA